MHSDAEILADTEGTGGPTLEALSVLTGSDGVEEFPVGPNPDSGDPNHLRADPVPAEIRRAGNPPPRVIDTIARVEG